MYRRILVCTDGSALAQRAAHEGVQLAAKLGASVVALLVTPPFEPPKGYETSPLAEQIERHMRESKAAAKRWLGAIAEDASVAGVRCETYDCGDRRQQTLRLDRDGFSWPRRIGSNHAGLGNDARSRDLSGALADCAPAIAGTHPQRCRQATHFMTAVDGSASQVHAEADFRRK
jgi:hypothetical protein